MKSKVLMRSGQVICWAGMLSLVSIVGCGGGEGGSSEKAATTESKPAAKEASVVDAATAGNVKGSVAFTGTAPTMQAIDMSSELTCHSEETAMYTNNVVVNDNGTLRHVFVYVKEGLEGLTFPTPTEAVVLNQQGCTYEPHMFGIQAKQPLLIKNSDGGVLHNIHAISKKGNGFNFGMPKVMESTKKFKKAEVMVRIKCDVHGWMGAYAGVLDHPYHSVTGADGAFDLSGLPAGDYVIEAWHEEYGTQTQSVTVTAKGTSEVAFTFSSE